MHRSRLGTLVIDCQTDDLGNAATFWSQALGCSSRPDPDDPNYLALDTPPDEVKLLLQRVNHPSRAHLDIETDDIEAEVSRLEALGAVRIAQIKRWWVMEAPSGHRFCVVPPQRPGFEDNAHEWF